MADRPSLVDEQRYGHRADSEQVQRIDHDRPIHLLPLHEQSAAVGVLLLDDPDHPEFAFALEVRSEFVPPGHVFATTRSPGSKNLHDEFLTEKLPNGHRLAVCRAGKDGVRKRFADPQLGCVIHRVNHREREYEQ